MKSKISKSFVWFSGLFLFTLVVFLLIDNIIMPTYVQHGKTTKVPNVIGKPIEEAQRILQQVGLNPKEQERKPDRHYPIGTVLAQTPIPNSEVKYGRGVYLIVSGGEQLITIPDLKAKSIREATFTLERYGLKLGTIQYEPSEEFFENTIIRQDPQAGARVSQNVVVHIVVSQGRPGEKEIVPNVVGKTLSEAERIILQSGFSMGRVTEQVSISLLPHTIIEQYPRAGELAKKGQPIDLIVAQKSETKPTSEF
ncbi:MAG: PASTA domain-containing protein [Bacteroidetes bacterium]|nr:PASTA domain-containing protein [Bacteroidota bacterium]